MHTKLLVSFVLVAGLLGGVWALSRDRKPAHTTTEPAVVRVSAQRLSPSPGLEFMVRSDNCDLIVIGEVTDSIVKPLPLDKPDAYMRQTIYTFQVEEQLKPSVAVNPLREKTIYVSNLGGRDDKIDYIEGDNPGLQVGERYLLFLKSNAHDRIARRYGFLPYSDGANIYKEGELSWFHFREIVRGKIHIDEKGICRVPYSPNLTELLEDWKFTLCMGDPRPTHVEHEAHSTERDVFVPVPDGGKPTLCKGYQVIGRPLQDVLTDIRRIVAIRPGMQTTRQLTPEEARRERRRIQKLLPKMSPKTPNLPDGYDSSVR